jgi:hypothetical protein
MGQVANVLTPLTPGQALGALLLAGCPSGGLTMVGAQSAVETAGWKSMHNWNFGNVTPTAAQVSGGTPWMTQNVKNMKYLAFGDPVSGAKAMVAWLSARGLLTFATQGNLQGYMGQLQTSCYLGCVGNTDPSTGIAISANDYSNYQAGISSWMSKLNGVTPVPPPMPGALSMTDYAIIGAALAGVSAVAYVHLSR